MNNHTVCMNNIYLSIGDIYIALENSTPTSIPGPDELPLFCLLTVNLFVFNSICYF